MFTWINVALTVILVALIWMFNKIKKIYTQLNKRNSKVPDVEILKKIIPPSNYIGWKTITVCNGIPIRSYNGTFTFAPNIFAGCVILQGKSKEVLEQLINVDTFTSLFPEYPSLKVEKCNHNANKDIVSLSNINTSLSLTSIVTCHLSHVNFTLERCWFNGNGMSWLYMCPTNVLLAENYGYWLNFTLQDLDNGNGCMLYVLGSFPSTVLATKISQMISSSLVLMREHIDSFCILKTLPKHNDLGTSKKLKNSPPQSPSTLPSAIRRSSKSPVHQSTPKRSSSPRQEAFGHVEQPAIIQHSTNGKTADVSTMQKMGESTVTKEESVIEPQKLASEMKDSDDTPSADGIKLLSPEVLEKLKPYEKTLKDGFAKLLAVYEADASTIGWEHVASKEGVEVFKKESDELSASLTFKGTTDIHVPLGYLLTYILNTEYKKEYDNLFENGEDIELIGDGLTKIINLQYQNVWPTTGRDFCSISALRHVKDSLYGVMVTAVTHPSCPPRRNKVRGEVIIGGFILNEKSSDPPVISLTYITRAELKGSIPQRIINRVNAEQPMFAASIRKHCERRYELQDPASDGSEWLSKIKASPSVYPKPVLEVQKDCMASKDTIPEVIKENNSETIIETAPTHKEVVDSHAPHEIQTEEIKSFHSTDYEKPAVKEINTAEYQPVPIENTETESQDRLLLSGFDLKENHYSKLDQDGSVMLPPTRMGDEDSVMNDTESLGDLSQFTEESFSMSRSMTQISVSDQALDLPRDSSGQIDYITLGNQTAALLEQEFHLTKSVSTSNTSINSTSDLWIPQGITKNVTIMRKISPSQKYHSFLGSGIINVLPVTVWEAIRNPTTRFVYDNMLKRTTVVKELTERHRILHMRHETNACFVKQARDFCLLTVERVEQERYVLASVSVDIPECPPVRDCVRGTVLASGWIVEPILKNGRYCSKVTYISQINFGGRLPTRLINFISKRQPLALAYLRDYLESAEL